MGQLAGISGKRPVKAFEKAGFVAHQGKGSHVTLKKPGCPILIIPMHQSDAPFLLRALIKCWGLEESEF